MQATYSVRRSSFAGFAILFAIVSALILGGLAGYWLKGLAPQVAVPATAVSAGTSAAVKDFAVPAGQAALSVQRRSGPAPGALKAAGDDSAPVVSISAPAGSGAWQQAHRHGGMQDSRY